MNILAIDQGTSGTKAIVYSPDGGVLTVAEASVYPVYLDGGGVEIDPLDLLESVLLAGRKAVAAAGRPIDAVALANQGETVLVWDPSTGEPLSAAVLWQDRRSEPICAELSSHAQELAARTGLVLDPYFSAPKMTWLRRNVTTAGVVTTTDTWLVHRLTGAFVTDASTASRSLLLDLDAVAWSPDLTRIFGLGAELLPRVVGSDEVVGTTTAFGGEVPVAGLVVDQQAALLAQGCLAPGTSKCTYGTGAFLLANTGDLAVRSSAGLTSSVAWRARERTTYCVDGQVYTAASAVSWIQELGLIRGAPDLDLVAADDAGSVLCVPALAGLAAPWWRPDARASFTGMTMTTGRGHLVAAVLQGIAAQVAELGRLVEDVLGRPLAVLRVDGGLTRSRRLMQAQADLSQVAVEVYPGEHATPMGAAALAMLALDPSLTLPAVLPAWTADVTYEPLWSADQAQSFRARWASAVDVALASGGAA